MNRENTIIDQAEKIFWDYISDKNIHSSEVISIATRNVESYLQHEVLSVEWIKIPSPKTFSISKSNHTIKIIINSF